MTRNYKDGPHATGNSESETPYALAVPAGPGVRGWRREATLALPVGEPDLEALRSVTREWLVPLLVEKFLREQGIELRARPNAGLGKTRISDL